MPEFLVKSRFLASFAPVHDPETFFNLPAAVVDLRNFGRRVFQVGTYRIEAVIPGFLFDNTLVKFVNFPVRNLSILSAPCFLMNRL